LQRQLTKIILFKPKKRGFRKRRSSGKRGRNAVEEVAEECTSEAKK